MLTNNYRRSVLIFYLACFSVCFLLLYGSHSLLHQTEPVFVINRLDLSLNFLLLTGLGNAVIENTWLQVLLDAGYILMPFMLLWALLSKSPAQYALAFLNVFYNIVYTLLLTSMSALSMQWFIASFFIPALFAFKREASFYYAFHCLRYLFIIFFFSAGLWKIRAGGVFNIEQMSAVLLKQHATLLATAPGNWYAAMILKIVAQPLPGYFLYLLGTLAELIFIVGLFTKKWDRLLLALLLLFIVFDFVLMKINYFPWVTFGFLFWYSKLKEPLPQYSK